METITYKTIDRAKQGWPTGGDWDTEPDKIQWADEATGLPCLAVRNGYYGHWCGYVGVSEGHPWHGKSYWDIPSDVHGGLTFSKSCDPDGDEATSVCHKPAAGEPDHVWWLGFDCAHSGDMSLRKFLRGNGDTYRTLEYVQSECAMLAQQAAAVALPQ